MPIKKSWLLFFFTKNFFNHDNFKIAIFLVYDWEWASQVFCIIILPEENWRSDVDY